MYGVAVRVSSERAERAPRRGTMCASVRGVSEVGRAFIFGTFDLHLLIF